MLRTDVPYVDQSGRLTQAGFQALQGASALGDLSDVLLTTPATGSLLIYNGTKWVNAEPTPLLGTITTTSGTSQSLSSLDLTPYKFLRLVVVAVSTNNAAWFLELDGKQVSATDNAAGVQRGIIDIDLTDGTFSANLARAAFNTSAAAAPYSGDTDITTATTTVTVSASAGTFDNGSIRVYGIR
jgi:hypothetical protein